VNSDNSTHEDSGFAGLDQPARLERRVIAPVIKVWARKNGQIVFGAIFPNCNMKEPNDEFIRLLSKRAIQTDGFGKFTASAMHDMVEAMFGKCEWEARFMRERRGQGRD
jgi:hypothetical protein